ncbi:hypothetical protein CDD81_7675 [Ophiocordyceps australis]|uniref:Uncharacterized protein n=1 Tax=Ophiocordyceps australis TaxID=1399860 RepID=A0A2C5Y4V0_9HYPO|nr:hypothetical protein CDD81_7675 [Ophiocordyceps australis]
MDRFLNLDESNYCYSEPVDDEDVRDNGCFTILPVRRNIHDKTANAIAHTVVDSWNKVVADSVAKGFCGTENTASGTFSSLLFPEASLDRAECISRLAQVFFLFDDKSEGLPQEIAHEKLDTHVAAILDDAGVKDATTATEKMLVPTIRGLLNVDRHRGIALLKAWRYSALSSNARAITEFTNFDEYIEFRIVNIGMKQVASL